MADKARQEMTNVPSPSSSSTTSLQPSAQSRGILRKKSASPYKRVRFSPYKLPGTGKSLLNLTGKSHAHPNPPQPAYHLPDTSDTSGSDIFEYAGSHFQAIIHVKLPFNLYQDGKQVQPTPEQRAQIMALFPTCFGFSFAPPFLVIRCNTLPPKPWPVTVAGLPLYLTNDPNEQPMDIGVTAQGPKLSIEAETGLWRTPSRQAFLEIFNCLEAMGATIDCVQWFGIGFKILAAAEPCVDWKKKLPGFINNLYVGYVIGEEIRHEKALRKELPFHKEHDNAVYSDFRPGIMLAGENNIPGDSREVLSTSGLCIQSPNGKKYVTVASHGFPNGIESEVKHPDRQGRVLGIITQVLGESDISLCELIPGIPYSRETFATTDADILSQPFRDFADTSSLRTGMSIYMDTPYSGRCEGTLMTVELRKIPQHDRLAKEPEYLLCTYAYFGNESDIIFDGCCGAVIWDDQYNAIGQFGFQSSEKNQ
ncbi:MAG: hypothetical protein Q9201_000968, partial [Fulgogasparrea decipioides]